MDNRICFVQPPYGFFMQSLDAPFTLMYLAAVAERCGWTATIVDMQSPSEPLPEADVYAVTSTSPQWKQAQALSTRIATEHPDSLAIVGGVHVSAEPEAFMSSDFHISVQGEGENFLTATLTELKQSPELMKEYCIMRRGIQVRFEPVEDLDAVPFPARHLVDWSRYKRGIYWGKQKIADAVSMITSRGCVHNCAFCGSHVVFQRRTRFRSIANVVEEIRQVKETIGYNGLNFHDDTMNSNPKRTFELCRELEKENVLWRCLTRVDTITPKILDAMGAAGCKEIVLGIESGSQKVLNALNKGVTVKQNLRAMKLIKNHKGADGKRDIQVKAGIIVGSPKESWQTVRETEKLLRECPPDFWNVNVLSPFPGSPIWNDPEKYGIKILSRDPSQYAMVGKNYQGTVLVETEEMTKADIEQARDELIELCLEISGPQYDL